MYGPAWMMNRLSDNMKAIIEDIRQIDIRLYGNIENPLWELATRNMHERVALMSSRERLDAELNLMMEHQHHDAKKADTLLGGVPCSRVQVYTGGFGHSYSSKAMSSTSCGLAYGIAHEHPVVFHDVVDSLVQKKDVIVDLRSLALSPVGMTAVDVTVLSGEQESKPPFDRTKMMLGMYCNALLDVPQLAKGYYLQQIDLKEVLPTLLTDAAISSYGPCSLLPAIDARYVHEPTFYIGVAGTKTSLHYDRSSAEFAYAQDHHAAGDPGKHNVFLQISGSRKFYLFQPSDYDSDGDGDGDGEDIASSSAISAMLPSEGTAGPHISRSMTFLHSVPEGTESEQLQFIQASEFPSLVDAWRNRLEITLEAGSALFIPAKTWHCTRLLESGVALNWWFARECSQHFPESHIVDMLANDNWID
jgi:hypothetical protein